MIVAPVIVLLLGISMSSRHISRGKDVGAYIRQLEDVFAEPSTLRGWEHALRGEPGGQRTLLEGKITIPTRWIFGAIIVLHVISVMLLTR
jgi:hypothetical protein